MADLNVLRRRLVAERPDLDGYTPDEAYEAGVNKVLARLVPVPSNSIRGPLYVVDEADACGQPPSDTNVKAALSASSTAAALNKEGE